jgi:2-C-methyl-D-erythritol 2,4-cyclodiphosphate synthase
MLLGGVRIPSSVHLQGHSDADAVCHAITDAVLGAAGAGDIGSLFPDTDAANAGRSSLEMLSHAVAHTRQSGWVIMGVDVTVITEEPRIGPHRGAMRDELARALGVTSAQVNVKGKSNEGMGWVGRGEGLACIAVATLQRAEH